MCHTQNNKFVTLIFIDEKSVMLLNLAFYILCSLEMPNIEILLTIFNFF